MGRVETSITQDIEDWANAQPHCKAVKQYTGGSFVSEVGHPDLVISARGRCILLEVKEPGKDLSIIQGVRQREWRETLAVCEKVTSLAEAIKIIERESSSSENSFKNTK